MPQESQHQHTPQFAGKVHGVTQVTQQMVPESLQPSFVYKGKPIAGPGPEQTHPQVEQPHAIQEQMQGQHQGDNPCPADGMSEAEHHHHAHEYRREGMPHGPRVALREGWRHDIAQRLINYIGQHGSHCDPACIDLAAEGTR